jgi:hypothetical protein
MIRTFAIGRKTLARVRTHISLTTTASQLAPFKSFSSEKRVVPGASLITKAVLTKPVQIPTTDETIPDSGMFAQLKSAEREQFPKKNRVRSKYRENRSAALALPCTTKELEATRGNLKALLAKIAPFVVEHANRRVDLFFYTAIAYYLSQMPPTKAFTSLQNGTGRTIKGNRATTVGCHSSLIPSLVDETIFANRVGKEKNKSILSGTHLLDSLNSTVELPPLVNAVDDVIENMGRQKCLKILGDVAQGTINPVDGLNLFLIMMQDILATLKKQAELKKESPLVQYSLLRQPGINSELIDLVTKGTLSTTFLPHTQTAADEYVQLLLRMTPKEKAQCEDEASKEKMYLKKIAEMQTEILQAKSAQHSPSA